MPSVCRFKITSRDMPIRIQCPAGTKFSQQEKLYRQHKGSLIPVCRSGGPHHAGAHFTSNPDRKRRTVRRNGERHRFFRGTGTCPAGMRDTGTDVLIQRSGSSSRRRVLSGRSVSGIRTGKYLRKYTGKYPGKTCAEPYGNFRK